MVSVDLLLATNFRDFEILFLIFWFSHPASRASQLSKPLTVHEERGYSEIRCCRMLGARSLIVAAGIPAADKQVQKTISSSGFRESANPNRLNQFLKISRIQKTLKQTRYIPEILDSNIFKYIQIYPRDPRYIEDPRYIPGDLPHSPKTPCGESRTSPSRRWARGTPERNPTEGAYLCVRINRAAGALFAIFFGKRSWFNFDYHTAPVYCRL